VYVGEECVIDVTMAPNGSTFNSDSMTCVQSSGKSVASVIFARLVDQGLVNYSDTVMTHWPEYAQNGKEAIKIEDVFRHESGMPKFSRALTLDEVQTEAIKKNSIGAVIEAEKAVYLPCSRRIYHITNRDWIVNEIFRRVEPSGRTMGEYLAQDLRQEFGFDIVCGMKEGDWKNYIAETDQSGWSMAKMVFKGPKTSYVNMTMGEMSALSKSEEVLKAEKKAAGLNEYQMSGDMEVDIGKKVSEMEGECLLGKDKKWLAGEGFSGNVITNAKGLAKMGAFMANKGSFQGKQYISEETWNLFHGEQKLCL
jgi:CubicO group peptidase (beta-lactamase class C family)